MKNSLKHTLMYVFFVVNIFTFSACRNDDNNQIYYIRFLANGTLIEYTNQLVLIAGFGQATGIYTGTVSGANDLSSNIGLQIYNNSPIVEGIYSGYGIIDNAVVGVIIGYTEKNSGVLFSSGGGPNVDATVEISELTSTSLRGTFKGTLLATGRSNISITDGSFFVRRAN
jgi:hypothetical protein